MEEGHEEIELGLGAFPVLGAEAEERQLLDAEPTAFLDRAADALYAAAVSLDSAEVGRLSQERADLVFELQVVLPASPSLSATDRDRTRVAAVRLKRAERRLDRIVTTVLAAVRPVRRGPPAPTYGRSGRLVGAGG